MLGHLGKGKCSDQAKCLPQRLSGADVACPGLHAPAAFAVAAAAAAAVLLILMQPAQCCMLEKQLLSCQLLLRLLAAAVVVSLHD